eukprot:gene2627-5529_t
MSTVASPADTCPVQAKAQSYYDSSDAETFYSTIWGGENIHIGIYTEQEDSIADASHKAVENLVAHMPCLNTNCHVLDLGSGYGGTARYLASKFGCHVTGLNLSEVENERARRLNKEQGLADKITIIQGTFENVDLPNNIFDVVCSQDAFLHSGNRAKVVAEAARLMKPGGIFVFTDIMQADNCDKERLRPILERIHLTSFGSPASYRKAASMSGLVEEHFVNLTDHLVTHYSRVLNDMLTNEAKLRGRVSDDYLARMEKGLELWVSAGRDNQLVWPLFVFRKPKGN